METPRPTCYEKMLQGFGVINPHVHFEPSPNMQPIELGDNGQLVGANKERYPLPGAEGSNDHIKGSWVLQQQCFPASDPEALPGFQAHTTGYANYDGVRAEMGFENGTSSSPNGTLYGWFKSHYFLIGFFGRCNFFCLG